MPSFIETQFPSARLSAGSCEKRKQNNGQTISRLDKGWERKPLILCEPPFWECMPASADAKKDREIFLKILTMDDAGAWQRCKPAVRRKASAGAFVALPYAARIADCERPANIEGPTPAAWAETNAPLRTPASSLP